MKISLRNQRSSPFWLFYDVHGSEGGVSVKAGDNALVTVARDDTDEDPVEMSIGDDKVHIWESSSVQMTPPPDPATAMGDYDELGRLANPAEWQQQVMLGLYDLQSDASVAEFSPEIVDELKQVRLRFMDEFEAKFPGYGKGRAVWR